MTWMIIALLLLLVCIVGFLKRRSAGRGPEPKAERSKEVLEESPAEKGRAGEEKIYEILEQLAGRKAFLPNCYLPKQTGGTTEIDLVMLHESGVYVIESKNYGGWIFGNETQQYWTQSLRGEQGTAKKNRFYNPLWQNEAHVRELRNLLQENAIPFYSYVVFGERCELKDITLTSGKHTVTTSGSLLREVAENARKAGKRLSNEKMEAIYQKLLPFTCTTTEQKIEHAKEVYRKQMPVVESDGTLLCPLCGGNLVPRVAKRGASAGKKFLGCSNYPKCRFTYDKP